MNRLRGVVTVGLYAAQLRGRETGFTAGRSARQFDTTVFAPGGEAGVELPFARYYTLTAGYRVGPTIHGVNTNGFTLAVKFF